MPQQGLVAELSQVLPGAVDQLALPERLPQENELQHYRAVVGELAEMTTFRPLPFAV